MICPRCQSTEYYELRGRKVVRCKRCKRDFSETSGTIWKSPKMSMERRQEIIDLLEQGSNAHAVSLKLGIQYKTVSGIAKKLKEDWEGKHSPSQPATFMIGDAVSRITAEGHIASAFVTGFCENERFVRVKDDNGRSRIWLKDNLVNEDDDVRRYCAPTPYPQL